MPDSKHIVILFNYGGGLRGLIPAHIMSRIEDRTGLRMTDMVDVFAGPSTGAILNAALNIPNPDTPAQPKFRARHMVKFYEREGIKIFPPDRFRDFRGMIHDFNNRTIKLSKLQSVFSHGHYDPAYLKKCLYDLFGRTRLSESLSNLVIPVYNIDGEVSPGHAPGGHALWLKKMKWGEQDQRKPPDVALCDAVLASCAAPTYFPCHHFKAREEGRHKTVEYTGIDGSIFDNPCTSYYGAIKRHLPSHTKLSMVMLGTGHNAKSFKKDEWNRLGGLGVVDPAHDLPLINILFHAPETALIESFTQELGDNAYVFNKALGDGTDPENIPTPLIDDASEENLKAMRNFAFSIMEENKTQLDQVCDLLVRNRDHKARQPKARQWFSFFTGK